MLQLAKVRGARTFGVDSAAKKELLEQRGAVAIDYRAETPKQMVTNHTAGRGFDIVYDTVGGTTLDASFEEVRRFGHVVSILGWGTHALAPLSFRAATYSGVFTLLPLITGEGRAHHGEILRAATELVESGQLVPQVDPRRFTLDTVGEAYELLGGGQPTSGKLVVDIDAP